MIDETAGHDASFNMQIVCQMIYQADIQPKNHEATDMQRTATGPMHQSCTMN
jgi:hypothetical protein